MALKLVKHMDLLTYIVSVFHILLFCNIVIDYIETWLHGELYFLTFLGFQKHKVVTESWILTTKYDQNIY